MYRKKRYFIGYDISKNKIRSKVQKELLQFGIRLQYSNYLCEFFPKDLQKTRLFCRELLEKQDSIIWIPVSDSLLKSISFQGKNKDLLPKATPKIIS